MSNLDKEILELQNKVTEIQKELETNKSVEIQTDKAKYFIVSIDSKSLQAKVRRQEDDKEGKIFLSGGQVEAIYKNVFSKKTTAKKVVKEKKSKPTVKKEVTKLTVKSKTLPTVKKETVIKSKVTKNTEKKSADFVKKQTKVTLLLELANSKKGFTIEEATKRIISDKLSSITDEKKLSSNVKSYIKYIGNIKLIDGRYYITKK